MNDTIQVNRPAPLKNVAAFSTLIARVVERGPGVPGLACFHGPSGFGKTQSAIFGANRYRARYVECGSLTTSRTFLASILKELGVERPRGTGDDMIAQAVELLVLDRKRPLIIDDFQYVADKRWADVVGELYNKSLAPILLIGEETLPRQLQTRERIHNRMLDWVPAAPCDLEDFAHLMRSVCPRTKVAADLAQAILDKTRGNTRRIVVNLSKAEEIGAREGKETVDLALFGGMDGIVGLAAPSPRKVA